jgi:hypothetical protein
MYRLTARLLLILLLLCIMAPAALATTTPLPHACCLRMKQDCTSTTHNLEFRAPPTCCNRDCCRPFTISQWGENPESNAAAIIPATTTLLAARSFIHRTDARSTAHSGRAPPEFPFSRAYSIRTPAP